MGLQIVSADGKVVLWDAPCTHFNRLRNFLYNLTKLESVILPVVFSGRITEPKSLDAAYAYAHRDVVKRFPELIPLFFLQLPREAASDGEWTSTETKILLSGVLDLTATATCSSSFELVRDLDRFLVGLRYCVDRGLAAKFS